MTNLLNEFSTSLTLEQITILYNRAKKNGYDLAINDMTFVLLDDTDTIVATGYFDIVNYLYAD